MILSYGKILEPDKEPQQDKGAEDFQRIIRLSLRTLFLSITFLSFLLMLYITFFPYKAMKFYTNIGLYTRALETSESYIKLNKSKYESKEPLYDSKFADALLSCVNLSVGLMEDSINSEGHASSRARFYAAKAEKYIDMYLSFNSMSTRSLMVDNYYQNEVGALLSSKSHVDYYSFDVYLHCMRARTLAIQNKTTEAFEYFTFLVERPFPQASEDSIRQSAKVFNIITTYYKTRLDMLGWQKLTKHNWLVTEHDVFEQQVKPTIEEFILLYTDRSYTPNGEGGVIYYRGLMPILERISPQIDEYKELVIQLRISSERQESLSNLYYAKSVTEFIYTIRNCIFLMNCYIGQYNEPARSEINALSVEWDDRLMYQNTSTSSRSLYEWYNRDMLDVYAARF